MAGIRDGYPSRGGEVVVGGDLQDGSDLRAAGELRVGDGVGAVRLTDQEVRVAEESSVEEDCLGDHSRTLGGRLYRRPLSGYQVLEPPGLRARHLDHPAGRLAVLRDHPCDEHRLECIAQLGGAGHQGVLGEVRPGNEAEGLVDPPSGGELAFRGGHEVRGGVHEVGVDQLH